MRKISELSDQAKIWVYVLRYPTSALILAPIIDPIVSGWLSHGDAVKGAWELLDNHFLILAGELGSESESPSGCSIDKIDRSIVHALLSLKLELVPSSELSISDPSSVGESQKRVSFISRQTFKELARKGEINGDTLVYDPSLNSLKDYRALKLLRKVRDSWHLKLLERATI